MMSTVPLGLVFPRATHGTVCVEEALVQTHTLELNTGIQVGVKTSYVILLTTESMTDICDIV